ncbi:MAG: type II toxin-antitoxin system RelE/ParE family toxin [Myxococcota bacterium]
MHAELHRAALEELAEAIDWYDSRVEGLGEELEKEVWATVHRIEQLPHARAPWRYDPRYRFARVERFPYALPYAILDDFILMLAVAHERRRTGYWLSRATDAR